MEPLENTVADAVLKVAREWLKNEGADSGRMQWGLLWQELRAAAAEAIKNHDEKGA